MLYALFEWLNDVQGGIPGFGVFKYLSFRSAMAVIFSLIISILIGKWIIAYLKSKLIGETIRKDGPASHQLKAGTPTMGGIIIFAAIMIPTLLWGDLTNAYVLLVLLATAWMFVIGFADDYIKVFRKNKAGLAGKFKILGQVGLGLIVGFTMVLHPDFKGPQGRVSDNGALIVGNYLAGQGFEKGDRLLFVDGKRYSKEVTTPGSQYIVERLVTTDGFTETKQVEIPIASENTLPVWNAFHGNREAHFETKTNVPFFKNYVFNYAKLAFWEDDGGIAGKLIYVLICIFIVTAVSNGVNLTDGLDGLAAGTTAIAGVVLFIFAYVSGNAIFSEYLNISYIPHAAELTIFGAAMVGACVGFLWYNAYPAQVFMGDTGSLMLGGAVGVMAMMVKKELLIPIFCGIFLVEALSVILQVSYFKYTKKRQGEGKRIFRMAPLHHHFEKLGMHETKIVARFWIVAAMLAVLAFVTLKLR
ncbi:MAG TPA: phospho-N-acetylmuramoyl-pentapeptide-transferase [Bacteroidetes bacterium]|nr:phospho-N-acetylmuramoyl-pentapeptide-transferase [Bacteroidota bacterium]